MLTAAGAQCHLTLLIKGERFPCSQKSIFLLLVTVWLQCNKCSSSVFIIRVPPGGGFVLDCNIFQGVSNIL